MLNRSTNTNKQYFFSILFVILISFICFVFKDLIGYKVIAFILLVTVSFLAMFYRIIPTLIGAILSALIWNFFFIKPYFTFHIENTEDVLMFFMYFVIALINAVLTFKIRQIEHIANKKDAKLKSIKLYNTLLDSLSHELKTPISAIIGSTDALQNNKTINDNQKEKLLEEISIATLRLNNQVENLLNMSRLESGVIVPKMDWVDVKEIIYGAIRTLNTKLYSQKIIVNCSEDFPLFKLDYGLTEHIIYNLLNNAIIYTSEHSTILINLKNNGNVLLIEILDEGKGFPKDEIDYVFDKFYRLKNSRPGGSGLGLSIVKGFVEAQNGEIALENRVEGGAKFTIKIETKMSKFNIVENE
ncbi:ATP-binding protein [Flavobacterium sp. 316]|uniref:sensor histidine kinase n=1 Tax=Flavobacterium sp. 316 TaxID=1603293 RepID=UPI0005FA3654|nr:ATP-binding protein [Flavobacterium sp. 316]